MAIIAAFKNGQTKVWTKQAHQFDKGQKLIVTGVVFPDTFEVHMSNHQDGGMAYSCVGHAEGIFIPDALFVSGDYIYVWIYATSVEEEGSTAGYDFDPEEDTIQEVETGARTVHEGETVYEIIIPIARRSVQLPTINIDPTGGFGYMVDENETLVPVNQ